MPRTTRLALKDESATLAVAARLARRLRDPMTVALSGPLGAGKTTFVRGVLGALGHRGGVPSPTFAMVNEYRRLRPRVFHMDLYRAGPEDLPGLALEEYFADAGAVCLVEWAENAGGLLPPDRVEAVLAHAPSGRTLRLRSTGPRAADVLRGL
ncbi:MAG: tRNA (adenosine(37)-N6)-threonylcarbamoyltransferase complex ATPase subunit type 1 TsaE [Elusimicrobia bacterium]|nr:tRNA (adenosine(37)-N6)-threonylcarbamoyltransferase complex ATPase subunit type 1 TsaE [Elusimicrobiota bacterium]